MCVQEESYKENSASAATEAGKDLGIEHATPTADMKRQNEAGTQDNARLKRKREENEALFLQNFLKKQPLSNQDQNVATVFTAYGISFNSPLMLLGLDDLELSKKNPSTSSFGCTFRACIALDIANECPQQFAAKILKVKLKDKLDPIVKTTPKFQHGIEKLVLHRRDEICTIWNTTKGYKSSATRTAETDRLITREFEWWATPVLRQFAFFRRLLLPIQRIIHHSLPTKFKDNEQKMEVSSSNKRRLTFESQSMEYSLMHLLLQCESIQNSLLKALFQRIAEIESASEECPSCVEPLSSLLSLIIDHIVDVQEKNEHFVDSMSDCLSKVKDKDKKIQKSLSPFLTKCIKKEQIDASTSNDASVTLQPSTPPSVIDFPVEKKKACLKSGHPMNPSNNVNSNHSNETLPGGFSAEVKWLETLPSCLRKEELKILEEAKTSLHEYIQSQQSQAELICRRSRRPPKMKNRAFDGSLIFDENHISRENFIKRTKFMNRVNEKFQRRYIPQFSRPTIKGFKFSKEILKEIRDLFFDEDGSLKNSICNDIDISMNNDPRLISFGKLTTSSVRNDKRWQVTIRKHGLESKVATRTKIEAIYRREGVLTPLDDFHELAILVGGTEDQRLHHDVARQMAIWYKEKPSVNSIEKEPPLTGWEVDRISYNQAMESPHSPSSMLTALHDSGHFMLGIQKDQIVLKSDDPTQCRVVGGCGIYLKIVRSNANLVVVAVPVGCIFSGDFPHCGVRNFREDTFEERLMETCIGNIESILKEVPTRERLLRSQRIIQMMCKLPGLNKLCRLHSSSEMVKGPFRQPRNAVGFSYCQVNERDARCKTGGAKSKNDKSPFIQAGELR